MGIVEGHLTKDAEERFKLKDIARRNPYFVFNVADGTAAQRNYYSVVAFISQIQGAQLKKGTKVQLTGLIKAKPFKASDNTTRMGLSMLVNSESLKVLEAAPVNAVTVEEYYKLLQKHDWYFSFSDDHREYAKGSAERSALTVMARQSPEHKKLLAGFELHHSSGPAWNTEQSPLPSLASL